MGIAQAYHVLLLSAAVFSLMIQVVTYTVILIMKYSLVLLIVCCCTVLGTSGSSSEVSRIGIKRKYIGKNTEA